MGQLDISMKTFLDHNDVFADVTNTLIFKGNQVISPDDLVNAKDVSKYRSVGILHQQIRDDSKLVVRNGKVILSLNIENQADRDRYMVIRVGSYDMSHYRMEMTELKENTESDHAIYPVLTLVLYYGLGKWHYHDHLKDIMTIHPDFSGVHFNDFKMDNVFQIAYLSSETVKRFKSDFRFIADYLVQMRIINERRKSIRNNHELTEEEKEGLRYKPLQGEIRHLEDLAQVMTALTGDESFYKNAMKTKGKDGIYKMEDIWSIAKRQGMEIGREEGIEIGKEKGKIEIYFTEMHLSPAQIAEKLGKPKELVDKVIQQLKK